MIGITGFGSAEVRVAESVLGEALHATAPMALRTRIHGVLPLELKPLPREWSSAVVKLVLARWRSVAEVDHKFGALRGPDELPARRKVARFGEEAVSRAD